MEGEQAPVVSGVDQYGKKIDLADVLGKKSLILFFYPKVGLSRVPLLGSGGRGSG